MPLPLAELAAPVCVPFQPLVYPASAVYLLSTWLKKIGVLFMDNTWDGKPLCVGAQRLLCGLPIFYASPLSRQVSFEINFSLLDLVCLLSHILPKYNYTFFALVSSTP